MELRSFEDGRPAPRVSIGMPAFNGAKYIGDAIDSLLTQTFTDFELVVSDDCSTDGTSEVVAKYATLDARVRFCRQQARIGMGGNFRYVYEAAQGEFFMWACQDDRWEPEFLRTCVCMLDSDPSAVAAFSHVIIRNFVTGVDAPLYCYPSLHKEKGRRLIHRILQGGNLVWFSVFRRDALTDEVGKGLHYDFFDLLLVYALTLKGRILIDNQPLFVCGVTTPQRRGYSITHPSLDFWNAIKRSLVLVHRELGRGAALKVDALLMISWTLACLKERVSTPSVRAP